jgi:hypothetical protein
LQAVEKANAARYRAASDRFLATGLTISAALRSSALSENPFQKAVDRTCAKALGKTFGDIVLDRIIKDFFGLDDVARH